MNTSDGIKLGAAVAVLSLAGFFFVRYLRQSDGLPDKAFFYDESQQQLFTADRHLVPPIKGLDDARQDAVRAIVISASGRPADKSSWQIAYLEKYSPELKAQMESAQASSTSPQMGRGEALAHRFVRRIKETNWFPMNSAEADVIVTEWANPGPDGVTPVLCAP